jgi:hypothetical protein
MKQPITEKVIDAIQEPNKSTWLEKKILPTKNGECRRHKDENKTCKSVT